LLNIRLLSSLLIQSVKKESNQVLAVRLVRAAQGVESIGITYARAKKRL
jgi:hypothetical protein